MMDRETLGRIVRDAWIAWARENPVRCERCAGHGTVIPACLYCDDSTYDHECPGASPCGECGGKGRLVRADWIAPWEELPEADREADRRIGEAIASVTREACAAICDAVTATTQLDAAAAGAAECARAIRAGGRDG